MIQHSDIFTSYNLRDSENKLAVPITIKIVSAIAVLFSGTVCPLLLGKQNLWLTFDRC